MPTIADIEQRVQVIQQEIKQYLPDITSEQAKKFAYQVIRLDLVKDYKTKYPEDFNYFELKDLFVAACKSLDYTKPYRIAIIGNTGVGKSTFNNSLVGRNLLFTRAEGKAATGTVLEIFFVEENEQEIAIVEYRNQRKIKALIKKVFQKLSEKNLINIPNWQTVIDGSPIDDNFRMNLGNLNPPNNLGSGEQTLFQQYKDTVVDIIEQYLLHGNLNSETFYLNNPEHLQQLNQLTDENSLLNNSDNPNPNRRIGLIEKVIYKIKPNTQNDNLGLEFPTNVCLVDLPGLDGSLLHDLIILDGIKDADAVIYINNPKRIDTNADLQLLSEVKSSITVNNNRDSYKGIFFILTSRDNITRDENYDSTQLPQNMRDFIDKFLPGYTQQLSNRNDEGDPYFYVSSIAAYYAKKLLRGETLSEELRQTYEQACLGLRIRNYDDYKAVLNASRMPKLIDKLKYFVLNERIDQQINNGKIALDSIMIFLVNKYTLDQEQQTRIMGNLSLDEIQTQTLLKKEKYLNELVQKFSVKEFNSLSGYQNKLSASVNEICQEIDIAIQKQMPQIWRKCVSTGRPLNNGKPELAVLAKTFLLEVQTKLWHQLGYRMVRFSEQLVQEYRNSLQQENLVRTITRECYETVQYQELENKLNHWIEKQMAFKLKEIASRIGLVFLGRSQDDLLNDNSEILKKNKFLSIIRQLPQQEELEPEKFKPLVQEIHDHYTPIITSYCLTALINVYRYEYTVIEENLVDFIRQTFHKLLYTPNARAKDKIQGEFNQQPGWRVLAKIENKLALLKAIP
ncbi:dynamin family protein [Okeania sp. SIO2B3]|uniref:dynamin family protein n=1 Tax=Okeania sp. SIO2B3 TaxID=2607784 RepID=UPI0013C07BD0|nr:dynamin family protein [Okeania sp. SIO2B3]NET45434.1 hypothetical protein [Okeania sp. SIO2B3]